MQGIDVAGNQMVSYDLSGLNLSGGVFVSTDLASANFSGANLTGADLFRANLENGNVAQAISAAQLRSAADIEDVSLHGNEMSGFDLHGVDLTGANLSSADLSNANLTNSNLSVANLDNANLNAAQLPGALPSLPVISTATVTLTQTTTVATSIAVAGRLNINTTGTVTAANGTTVQHGGSIVAASGDNAHLTSALVNDGSVQGPSTSGKSFSLDGDVTGSGAFSGNLTFEKAFTPGAGATVNGGTITFDADSVLTLNLSGVDSRQRLHPDPRHLHPRRGRTPAYPFA